MAKYNLVGVDGNAFSIMGYVRNAMKKEGVPAQDIAKYTHMAMAGDYNELIRVSMIEIDSLNKKGKII